MVLDLKMQCVFVCVLLKSKNDPYESVRGIFYLIASLSKDLVEPPIKTYTNLLRTSSDSPEVTGLVHVFYLSVCSITVLPV